MKKEITIKVEVGSDDPRYCNTRNENGIQTSSCQFLNIDWVPRCVLHIEILKCSKDNKIVVSPTTDVCVRCSTCLETTKDIEK